MTSKECEEQLNSLIEHFNNGGMDINATDIEAVKHLLLENQIQHDEINKLREKVILLQASEPMLELEKYYGERDKYKEVIEEVREVIDTYKYVENDDGMYEPILDGYDIQKLLQILDKAKEVNK